MAEEAKKKKTDYIATVGRRKESIARVRLYKEVKESLEVAGEKVKKGDFFVNAKRFTDYFKGNVAQLELEEPFKITNNLGKFAVTVRVTGGGQNGQLKAVVHGVSRALGLIDQKNRDILKKKGFLTRDARVRQRRNVGMGGKARRKKQSPKR